MVSSGLVCAGNGRQALKILCVGAGSTFDLQKAGIRRPLGRLRLFPWLRRKSGLCYTADANSPFEAYIYVR
jgi:hypothetical protein